MPNQNVQKNPQQNKPGEQAGQGVSKTKNNPKPHGRPKSSATHDGEGSEFD